ncbi:hypothetical protein OE88DRAFT_333834 [Heliocybe sulcata]|uniref:Uncharacterized protein n=1 Tax=Heliocybe sulcata TaxID=5364 RepID=A0A5C3MZL1_9AGAM|nr:hypothetical protein OE88DRAFT_333834 [Heliocybe sulcata]
MAPGCREYRTKVLRTERRPNRGGFRCQGISALTLVCCVSRIIMSSTNRLVTIVSAVTGLLRWYERRMYLSAKRGSLGVPRLSNETYFHEEQVHA